MILVKGPVHIDDIVSEHPVRVCSLRAHEQLQDTSAWSVCKAASTQRASSNGKADFSKFHYLQRVHLNPKP